MLYEKHLAGLLWMLGSYWPHPQIQQHYDLCHSQEEHIISQQSTIKHQAKNESAFVSNFSYRMLKTLFIAALVALVYGESRIKLYQHYKKGGKTRVVTDTRELGDGWNEMTSVVDVTKGNWIFYDKYGFKGRILVAYQGDSISMPKDWNDKLASVETIGSRCSFENVDFPGHDLEVIDNIRSSDYCRDRCARKKSCKAFSYKMATQRCNLKDSFRYDIAVLKNGHISARMSCY